MHLPLWIAGGVTNVRDMMDCPREADALIACTADKRRWNAASQAGRMAAPTIREMASHYLEQPSITPAEATGLVKAYAARGVDAIKVYNRLSRPAYFAAASAAQAADRRLVGHLPKVIALGEAIGAGQISFEHGHVLPRHCFAGAAAWRSGALDAVPPTGLAEQVVAQHDPDACTAAFTQMAAAGAWLVPTHVTREEDARAADPAFHADPRLDAYLDPLSRWAFDDDLAATRSRYPGARGALALRRYFDHGLTLTGRAHAAGVGILVGTDTVIGGLKFHDEMAHLAAAGLSNAAVLRAATLDAARYAGQDRVAGSVAVGKRADLVLLAANPLENIGNSRSIRAVVHHGRLYDRAALARLQAFTKEQAVAPHNMAKLIWGFIRSSVRSDL